MSHSELLQSFKKAHWQAAAQAEGICFLSQWYQLLQIVLVNSVWDMYVNQINQENLTI